MHIQPPARRRSFCTAALLAVLVLELSLIAFSGLTRTQALIDHDSGALLRHTMAVADARSLWVSGWNTPSTLEWDSVLVPASLFYSLTGNIYLSAALGNLLLCAALCCAVFSIMRKLRLPRAAALCALALLFAPYAVGMLDYANMLYLCGAQYAVKVLIPLLLYSVLLTPRGERRRAREIALLLFYMALLFLSCVSSGCYVFLCGVAPVLLAFVLLSLYKGRVDRYAAAVLGGSVLVAAAGYALCMRLNASSATAAMTLIAAQRLPGNVAACLTGILELFGAAASQPVAVLSLDGLARLARLAVVLALLGSAAVAARRLRTSLTELSALCLCAFFVNLAVLMLCDTTYGAPTFEYRYHLLGVVPLMLLPGALLFSAPLRPHVRRAAVGALCALLLLIDVTGARKLLSTSNRAPEMDALYQEALTLREQYGADALFMLAGLDERAGFQVLSLAACKDGVPALRVFEDGRIDLFNQPLQRRDISDFGDVNLVIARDASLFSPAIAQELEPVGGAGGYTIYLSRVCIFDGHAGVPATGESVDTPLTQGYCFAGEGASLSAGGSLRTSPEGGLVFWGPACNGSDGVYDVTLEYDVEPGTASGGVRFYMTEGYNTSLLAETTLDAGAHSATLHGVSLSRSMSGLEVRVHAPAGVSLRISRIRFARTGETL